MSLLRYLQHLMAKQGVGSRHRVEQWVRVCGVKEAPVAGGVMEADAAGRAVCLANVEGSLRAVDNWCPHRQGPLGQGWMAGSAVVCPWHCWEFDTESGEALPPESGKVAVFPVKVVGDDVLVNLG